MNFKKLSITEGNEANKGKLGIKTTFRAAEQVSAM
jgi:hypothetical protein